MNSVYVVYKNTDYSCLTDKDYQETVASVLSEAATQKLEVSRIIWEHASGDNNLTEVWEPGVA
jgi:hypothetical protein